MKNIHKIQWLNLPGYTGETWNPIIGCSKISDGCKNCYAERMANRLAHNPKTKADYAEVITDGKWNGKTNLSAIRLFKARKWRNPRVVFVCSMSDLFHESTSFEHINAVFSTMAEWEGKHIFIVLTKRPELMVEFYKWKGDQHNIPWRPSNNVWIGVTAENQTQAMIRIPYLISIPAAVKFVSVEPMLSQVDLDDTLQYTLKHHAGGLKNCLSWVICGGESGHNARPVHPDWVRSLKDQCQAAGVPFFFKQWGEWMPATQIPKEWGHFAHVKGKHSWVNQADGKDTCVGAGEMTIKTGKHKSGNTLDGVKYEQYPIINL